MQPNKKLTVLKPNKHFFTLNSKKYIIFKREKIEKLFQIKKNIISIFSSWCRRKDRNS